MPNDKAVLVIFRSFYLQNFTEVDLIVQRLKNGTFYQDLYII